MVATKLDLLLGCNKSLNQFVFRQYTFAIQFSGQGIEGAFDKLFRAAFGATLHKSTCFCKSSKKHLFGCVYSELFESPIPQDKKINRFTNVPHPFVFEISQAEDGQAHINITLFGKALRYIPYVIMTIIQMGRAGIGKGGNKFDVVQIHSHNDLIYDGDEGEMITNQKGVLFYPQPIPGDRVQLYFNSPLNMVYKNRAVKKFDLRTFFESLLRRLHNLIEFHQNFTPQWSPAAVASEIENIISLDEDLTHPIKRSRYSKRQQREMDIGGIVGGIVIGGDINAVAPLLQLGTIIHVGKKTSFGNGHYTLLMQEDNFNE